MLKIRLARTGRKNYPSYRIVVAESHLKRDGKCIEVIGNYNLQTEPPSLTINKDRFQYWIEKGAQPSVAARKLWKNYSPSSSKE